MRRALGGSQAALVSGVHPLHNVIGFPALSLPQRVIQLLFRLEILHLKLLSLSVFS